MKAKSIRSMHTLIDRRRWHLRSFSIFHTITFAADEMAIEFIGFVFFATNKTTNDRNIFYTSRWHPENTHKIKHLFESNAHPEKKHKCYTTLMEWQSHSMEENMSISVRKRKNCHKHCIKRRYAFIGKLFYYVAIKKMREIESTKKIALFWRYTVNAGNTYLIGETVKCWIMLLSRANWMALYF